MSGNVSDAKRDVTSGGLYLVSYFVLAVVIAPWFFLFAGGGAERQLDLSKFMLYIPIGIAMVLVLVFIKIARNYKSARDRKWFDVVIHDPEKSVFAFFKNTPFRFFYRVTFSKWLLFLFALLLFIPFTSLGGFLQQTAVQGGVFTSFFPQTAFPGSRFFTEQQVTETADLGLSVYPASPVETLQEIVIIALTQLFFLWGAYKKRSWYAPNIGVALGWIFGLFIGAISHMLQHALRYGSSDVSLFATFNFGLVTALLYLMFASIVIAIAYHEVSNAIFKLFEANYAGSDLSILVIFGVWVLILLVFVYSYRKIWGVKSNA